MDNLAIADLQADTPFTIDSDSKAEWALQKLREAEADRDRWIEWYKEQIEKCKASCESNTNYLKGQLEHYFTTVPHKATKTQESYKLPSGTLKLKKPAPEYQRDEETIVAWLEQRNLADYIKVKKTADWAELKKTVTVDGDKVVTEDGEIVDGITVVEREPEFVVEG